MQIALEDEPLLDASEIQGNSLRGFDNPYQLLIGLKIDNAGAARAWLRTFPISSLAEVHAFRLGRTAGERLLSETLLINVAFSKWGLDKIGYDSSAVPDGFFQKSMGQLAAALGDQVTGGVPANYVTGALPENTADIFIIAGCETANPLKELKLDLEEKAAANGTRFLFTEFGQSLEGAAEHFGFRDGVSTPGPRGLLSTTPAAPLTLRYIDPAEPDADLFGRPGQYLVWPGQFVFGYATQAGDDPRRLGPKRQVPDWMSNGSLLVYRRLKQDVIQFKASLSDAAQALSRAFGRTVTVAEIAARLVGRWQDGTPLVLADQPDGSISGDINRVNYFAFDGLNAVRVTASGVTTTIPGHPGDVAGRRCPLFAHVRKVNPRDQRTNQGAAAKTLTFQMLRRGIPFGPPLADDPSADRGLLFLSYQTSIADQFQELNHDWMNSGTAPEFGPEGFDLLVGQNQAGPRTAVLHDEASGKDATITFEEPFVIPTGGGFFFVPAISLVRGL